MVGYYYYLTKIRPYFTQTEKANYTLILLSILTVLVFGIVGMRPLVAATIRAYDQLQEGERYETELTEKILSLNQVSAAFFSSAEISQLGAVVPESHTQAQILQSLDNDAATAGLTLKGVIFRPQEQIPAAGKIGSYTFDFFAEGPGDLLAIFLAELERGQLVQLELLQTSLRPEKEGAELEVFGRGKAFYLQ